MSMDRPFRCPHCLKSWSYTEVKGLPKCPTCDSVLVCDDKAEAPLPVKPMPFKTAAMAKKELPRFEDLP